MYPRVQGEIGANILKLLLHFTCDLPQKTGPCRGSFRKYFYNGATGQCEKFTYGGCKGNLNNFDSQAECENRCGGGGKECYILYL
jgi:hypothetical protein